MLVLHKLFNIYLILLIYIFIKLKLFIKKLKFFNKFQILSKKKKIFKNDLELIELNFNKEQIFNFLYNLEFFKKKFYFLRKKKKFTKIITFHQNYFFFKNQFIKFFKKKKKIKKKGFLLIPLKYLKQKKTKKNIFFKKITFFNPTLKYYNICLFKLRKRRKKLKKFIFFYNTRCNYKLSRKYRNHKYLIKRVNKRLLRRFKYNMQKKNIFLKKKIFFSFNIKPINTIIQLLNIKYIKNLRLFLFYKSYVKFNLKYKLNTIKTRWTQKTPLARLHYFYKLHLFMKSFRVQILIYEYVPTIHKKKILNFFKTTKSLYPLEFLWFREYSHARILIRLKFTNSLKLSMWLVKCNWLISNTFINWFDSLKFNKFYFFLLNFYTLSLVKYNFKKLFRLMRFFKKLKYIHRKIVKLFFKNFYLHILTLNNIWFNKLLEIDYKQFSWILIFTKSFLWHTYINIWLNYWNLRVFGWKFIT